MKTYFDIETGPLPESELLAVMPEFNPSDVKLGNLKDAEKIQAKIAEARDSHRADFTSKAALDARYGQVLAVGFVQGKDCSIATAEFDSESSLVESALEAIAAKCKVSWLVGFYCKGFDLPFLIRRAWKLKVPVPSGIYSFWKGRVQWNDNIVDLCDLWRLGDYQAKGSLDSISQHLGVGRKNGSGVDFARLLATEPAQARAYLENDLRLTAAVGSRMGF